MKNARAAQYAGKAAYTEDVDIVVVGAGASGLTAAVEALLNGASVLVLESQTKAGGNGSTTSVVMGVGTPMQEKLGISLTPAEIINAEMETFNYSVDGVRWSSLVRNSADNIQWLIDQGCQLNGNVDNYHGVGVVDTGHWWTGDTGRDGETGHVAPMVNRVEELGGRILYEVAGKALIMDDDGAAAGVYAETQDGVLQVNAKAVILATGGYANNNDILEEKRYDSDGLDVFGMPGHNGDGILMALAAGGKSWLNNSSLMEYPMNPKIGRKSNVISRMPNSLWVNGSGTRFVDENCSAKVPARAALAVRTQDVSYAVFDQAILDAAKSASEDVASVVEQGVSDGYIFKADSIEDLAAAVDMDASSPGRHA
ncbi:FAD-dependent oxidoreductase [Slackia exigua]|uniref:FAD-dependent oxidoreductase n=1 Tax=Slackia exigua TaxID=84109 RepID=UPI0031F41BC5|nr:FAD-dependent oxidoreductase [Slackia exigua]